MKEPNSIGKENALKLVESKWWEGKDAKYIVNVQLFTAELCMPFDLFHKAIEEALGRPVFTHEFGMNWDGIVREFLGEKPTPTFEEVMNLIPEEKRVVMVMSPEKPSATVMSVDVSKHSAKNIADAVDKAIRARR